MVISKTRKMTSLQIVNQKRTELKTRGRIHCSAYVIWPLDLIKYFLILKTF